ncbi:MAG: UvrD-helicase domain-containing protein [Planctomycetota bacterium]|nr:UvrD-helicase domain-containing protein [Planctomycetota bacterium]
MTTRSVIIASAGSGKTFTLSNRLIGWMVHRLRTEGDPGCDRILASTFTRKAAGEIQSRILEHLAQAVLDPEAMERYQASFGLQEPPSREEVRTVLSEFIHNLHRIQISTLDGVFHRICQCFPSEVGLPANWTIADSSSMDRLRSECVNEVLDSIDSRSMSLLVTLMQRGERKRSIHGDITRRIWGGGFRTELLQLIRATRMAHDPEGPWSWLAPAEDGSAIDGGQRLDPGDLAAAISSLAKISLPLTKAGTENKDWVKARDAMVSDLEEAEWEQFLGRGLTMRCSADPPEEFSKAMPTDAMIEVVELLVRHAKAEYIRQRHEELVATRSILLAIEAIYRRRQFREGLYTFGDIEQMLAEAGVVQRESLGALWFRLDGMIRDIAFDEFQDTSTRQFEVLDPLIEEVLSGDGGDVDRGFLVLADPKQSIYGWRGGTPGLVSAVESTYSGRLDEEAPLARSWRSSRVVLDVVNMVFDSISDNQVWSSIDGSAAGVNAWADRFQTHEAARDLPGFVQVLVPDPGESKPGLEHALEEVVKLLVERTSVAPGRTIGVLVSQNSTATRLVAMLRNAEVDASEEGSSLLVDSPAVLALLSLLHLAEHPGDTRSLYHVAKSPLGAFLELDAIDGLDRSARRMAARDLSRRIRAGLLSRGYGEYIQSLVQGISGSCTPRDSLRLRQLVELADEWEPNATLQPGDFTRYVLGTPRSASTVSPVRVMTIHKAKGLEFDEVVLPELTRDFSRITDSVYLHRENPTSPPTRVVPLLNKSVIEYFPTLNGECRAARFKEVVQDALSVLYVAMTRARHAIHIIMLPLVDGKEDEGPPSTATGLLRIALPGLDKALKEHAEQQDHVVWTHGDPSWSEHADEPVPATDRLPLARPVLKPSSRRHRPRVAPSSRGTRTASDVLGAWRLAPRGAADRGTLLHELFRHVGWIEDALPSESEIQRALSTTAMLTGAPVGEERRNEALGAFHRALEGPAVRLRLSREVYADRASDELVLWRERPMHVQLEDEVLVGRFDRVVIGYRDGRPAWADVIDFKSDAVADDGGASLLNLYAPQLDTYASAICRMLDLTRDMVTTRLLLIGADIDLELAPPSS